MLVDSKTATLGEWNLYVWHVSITGRKAQLGHPVLLRFLLVHGFKRAEAVGCFT